MAHALLITIISYLLGAFFMYRKMRKPYNCIKCEAYFKKEIRLRLHEKHHHV